MPGMRHTDPGRGVVCVDKPAVVGPLICIGCHQPYVPGEQIRVCPCGAIVHEGCVCGSCVEPDCPVGFKALGGQE